MLKGDKNGVANKIMKIFDVYSEQAPACFEHNTAMSG